MIEQPHCPLPKPLESPAQALLDLRTLLTFLEQNPPIEETIVFPRGTIAADGRLDLCKQRIGTQGAQLITDALRHNTGVVSLLLGTNGIGDTGARNIAQLVRANHCLKVLYLGCNAISDRGIEAIALALRDNESVTGLWLKRNPIGAEGAHHLADMLSHNQSIRSLDLVHTHIGDEGMAAILATLTSTNRAVERLYLGGNQISARHANLLANLLRSNNRITGLFLNVSCLEDDGAEILAAGLSENQTLVDLGLASNGIQDRGCRALVGAIMHHPSLRRLDLGYSASTKALGSKANNFGDQAVKALAHYVKSNASLWTLNLLKTGIAQQGIDVLTDALEQNHTLCELTLATKQYAKIESLLERNRLGNGSYANVFPDSSLIRSVYR